MGPAPGIGERLLALEVAVAALQAGLRGIVGAGRPDPTPEPPDKDEPSSLEQLAQQLGNARLAAVLVRAGYTSRAAVAAAPDDALLAIDGVGEKALRAIREKVG